MKPIHSILAPLDFSESSHLALQTAVDLAKRWSAELHLLHAFEPPALLSSFHALSAPAPFVSEARDVVARKLEKSCQTATDLGVSVKSHLGTAPAAGAIVDLARQLAVDLVVMGTRGHTGLKHVLLGSVAERTVREAPCNVLTVKRDRAPALKTIERIIVAVDFSEYSDQALDAAIEFAKQLGAELHLIHAFEVRIPLMTPYDVALPATFLDQTQQAAASKLEVLVEKVAAQGMSTTSHLGGVPAASAIVALADKLAADLIVMGTRGHTGLKHVLLGSVAERTLRHAPCSVLAVKLSSG